MVGVFTGRLYCFSISYIVIRHVLLLCWFVCLWRDISISDVCVVNSIKYSVCVLCLIRLRGGMIVIGMSLVCRVCLICLRTGANVLGVVLVYR